jgi:hypothetical protein
MENTIDFIYSDKNKNYDILNNKITIINAVDTIKSTTIKNRKIVIADTKLKLKIFILQALLFAKESSSKDNVVQTKYYLSIDFEFNNQKIALAQICFDIYKTIWIVDFTELDKLQKSVVVDELFVNKNIIKILHGSESLDLPYIYKELFDSNKKKFVLFTKKMYDTRFLCDYYKSVLNEHKKCSLYNALLYFGVISQEYFDELEQMNTKMGPIYKIHWNVHKIQYNKPQLMYAALDVLYLKKFLLKVFSNVKSNIPEYYPSFKFLVTINRFIFVEKRKITNINDLTSTMLSNINKAQCRFDKQPLDVYYLKIISDLTIDRTDTGIINVQSYLKIDYFKNTINDLFKIIVFNKFLNSMRSKLLTFQSPKPYIDTKPIYDQLKKYKQYNLIKFCKYFENEVVDKMISVLQ